MEKTILAQSFQGSGEDHEQFRPGFPPDVLPVFLAQPVSDILDLGAGTGTGKLTRLLEDWADQVVAVDPSEQMLRQLTRAAGPIVDVRQGSAEDIPMTDSAVDLVALEPRKQELPAQMPAALDHDPETAGQSTLCLRQATDVLVYRAGTTRTISTWGPLGSRVR